MVKLSSGCSLVGLVGVGWAGARCALVCPPCAGGGQAHQEEEDRRGGQGLRLRPGLPIDPNHPAPHHPHLKVDNLFQQPFSTLPIPIPIPILTTDTNTNTNHPAPHHPHLQPTGTRWTIHSSGRFQLCQFFNGMIDGLWATALICS